MEISRHLNVDNKDDILNELRSAIQEQWERGIEESGRELSDEEKAASLLSFGHPMVVAAQFNQQNYLIGPAYFPFYKHAVKTSILLVIGIQLALAVITTLTRSEWSVGITEVIVNLLDTAVFVTAIVTLIFVVLEKSNEKLPWFFTWDPKSLLGSNRVALDRQELFSNLITESVFLVWWNGWLSFEMANDSSGLGLALGDHWQLMHWPINVVFCTALILHLSMIITDRWNRTNIIIELLLDVASLGILLFLLSAEQQVTSVLSLSEDTAGLVSIANSAVFSITLSILLVMIYETWKHVKIARQLLKDS
jgi:hypothetical protein